MLRPDDGRPSASTPDRAESESAGFAADFVNDDWLVRVRQAGALPATASAAEVGSSMAGGAAAELPSLEGVQVGRYRLLRRVGLGGMGEVYEAEQESPRRTVALKLIAAGVASAEALRRFQYEAEVLGRLLHPGIAQVYEAGVAQTPRGMQPFFAMEFVRGRPLTEHATVARLGTAARLELLARVADAVQHAHAKGVIHRDLKPANILVNEEGQPKVLDFGVARATDGDLRTTTMQTGVGALVGTVPYMSPEQAAGDPREIDTRSDVYALGVVLYELLTTRLPHDFGAKLLHEAVRMIREEEPTRLSRLNAAWRGDVETIVGKALEKDKERRYPTAAALAADIRRHLRDEPIAARAPSAAYQLRKFARRNKALVGGVAATMVALAGGLVASTALYVQAEAARKREAAEHAIADAQRRLAETRAEETRKVADFHASLLDRIDVEAMGNGIKSRYRDQVRASLERQYVGEYPDRRRRAPEEVEAELTAYDARAAVAQAADVARAAMDEYVLKPAATAAAAQFAEQPGIQAQIEHAIGSAYSALGLYDTAELHVRQALARRQEAASDDGDVADSLRLLAHVLHEKGNYAEEAPLLRDALARYERIEGPASSRAARTKTDLGWLLLSTGDYSGAEAMQRDALAIQRKLHGEVHADVATCVHAIGAVLHARAEYAGAEELYREALAIRRQLDVPIDQATSMNDLAGLLHHRGDLAAADALYREALAVLRTRLGDEHPFVATVLSNLAGLCLGRGDAAEAEQFYREALALRRRLLGPAHPWVGSTLNGLGLLLHQTGRFDEAEASLREALAIRRAALGDENVDVAVTLHNLGLLYQSRRQLDAAENSFREALALRRNLLGDAHPQVALTLACLMSLLQVKGRLDEAETVGREALAIREKRLGPRHFEVGQSQMQLASLLRIKGDFAGAEPLYRDALEIIRENQPARRLELVVASAGLAATLVQRARDATAPPETRRAVLAEAETLLQTAEETAVARAVGAPGIVRLTLETFVQLYDSWDEVEPESGYDEQAAQRRARLSEWQATTQPAADPRTSTP